MVATISLLGLCAPALAQNSETANAPGGAWMVQVGSFGEEQNARRLADRVATFGLTAHVFPSTSNGSSVFRVRVGPTSSRQSAAAVAAFLSANGFEQPWVLNEPGQVVVYAAEPSPAPANIQTATPPPGASPALEPAVSPTETVVEIGTKSATIGRGDAPVIDGQLDEADWERATLIDDFHQYMPFEYTDASQPTEIRIYYGDDALYIGVRMHDSTAEEINANVLRQGAMIWGDDFISVNLHPFNDKRTGYRFLMNPNAIRAESLFYETTGNDSNWNGIWHGATSRDEGGWTAEIEIPFKTLSFDPQNDTWGINFQRNIGRGDERIGWVTRDSILDPSIAGEITGLENLQLGRGLDIVPSITMKETKDYGAFTQESSAEPSLDLFYKITPALNAALTLNTDFSATEVDDRQVELTRFSLFFPEKRTFFLRDADMFSFARVGGHMNFGPTGGSTIAQSNLQNGRPYFSRRIGLNANGQPVGLDVGTKLSGRIGRWNVGTLAIRQEQFSDIDASDIFVGRVATNVLEESTVGFIATSGDPRSNADNSLAGFDFLYNNTRLPNNRSLQGEAWYQQSDTQGFDEDQSAYGLRLRSPNTLGWRGGIGVKQIEENFFPALGYVNRSGIRDHTLEVGYALRVSDPLFRTLSFGVDAERIDLITGGLQTQVVTLRAMEFDSHSRDRGHIRIHETKETLTEPYEIWEQGADAVTIPVGDYSFSEAEIYFRSGPSRTFWGTIGYRSGEFYDGHRQRKTVGVGWRPSNHYQFNLNYTVNDVELPYGDFTTQLVQLRNDIIFSSTMSWSTLLQYDNITEAVGINTRLHWIPRAGQEGFIVLNHNLQDIDLNNRFKSTLADLAVKFNYTFRF